MATPIIEWTCENIQRLRNLWASGAPTATIAVEMGLGKEGKSAIVGKAHRLQLERRLSPIKRDPNAPPAAKKTDGLGPHRVPVVTLPPIRILVDPIQPDGLRIVEPEAPRPVIAAPPAPHSQPKPVPQYQGECQWPIRPEKRGYLMCGDPALRGRPYCADHCKHAYMRIRDRSKEAAD